MLNYKSHKNRVGCSLSVNEDLTICHFGKLNHPRNFNLLLSYSYKLFQRSQIARPEYRGSRIPEYSLLWKIRSFLNDRIAGLSFYAEKKQNHPDSSILCMERLEYRWNSAVLECSLSNPEVQGSIPMQVDPLEFFLKKLLVFPTYWTYTT